MVLMGVFGKAGAIFTTIPSPVIGGMFMVMFGVISAAGVSNLQVYARTYIFLVYFSHVCTHAYSFVPCISSTLI